MNISSSIKPIIVNAPAKINLHLEVLGFRSDGFHELAMVMQSINLSDLISFKYRSDANITLSSDDINLSNGEDNLIIRAAKLLRNYSQNSQLGADIKLTKKIPVGAGLAGGSSDAAATLYGLNLLWELGLSNNFLESMSSELGSDVPFCLSGGTQICFGRGEILEKSQLSTKSLGIVLLKDPLTSVSTPVAYSEFKKKYESKYIKIEEEYELRRNKLRNSDWLKKSNLLNLPPLQNDLEDIIAPITPSVRKSLKILRSLPGSLGAAMSGSGPSCFALFKDISLAQAALNSSISKIELAGLDYWSCSLLDEGVGLTND